MFFIATMTLTPSRMATKLVANWFLRSKISRQTRVCSFMGVTGASYFGGEQQPGAPLHAAMAFFSEASSVALDVAPSTFVTIMPGGARRAVLAVLAFGSALSCASSLASLGSLGSTLTISVSSAYCASALNSLTDRKSVVSGKSVGVRVRQD